MRRLPPLNSLRVFDAAARCLNFSVAAEELCVTHSAVSHQMRLLEDWLGCAVFVRHAGGVRLTPAGESLLLASSQAFDALEYCCDKLRQQQGPTEITLGAPASFLSSWLIPRLESFERAHRHIQIRLQTSADLDSLRKQRVDGLITSAMTWPADIQATRLLEERTGPICLINREPLPAQPSDLINQPLLHTQSHPQAWADWAMAQHLPAEHFGFNQGRQFDHMGLMLEGAAVGLGMAIAPDVLVERELSRRQLMAPLGFIHTGAHFAFCVMKTRQNDAALNAVTLWLQTQALHSQASG